MRRIKRCFDMAENDPHNKGRRGKLETYLDVLWALKKGEFKPTRIMTAANLSWRPIQRILKSLITQGLVEEIDVSKKLSWMTPRDGRSKKEYGITAKGEDVLRHFSTAKIEVG